MWIVAESRALVDLPPSCLPRSMWELIEFTVVLEDAPPLPGTYALLMRLEAAITERIGQLGEFNLPEGDYVYVGSARGPGGLKARLRRHGASDKLHHWHVDYLTEPARILGAYLEVGLDRLECEWARCLCVLPEASRPVSGFGSSDCHCAAHLVRFNCGSGRHLLAAALFTLNRNKGG